MSEQIKQKFKKVSQKARELADLCNKLCGTHLLDTDLNDVYKDLFPAYCDVKSASDSLDKLRSFSHIQASIQRSLGDRYYTIITEKYRRSVSLTAENSWDNLCGPWLNLEYARKDCTRRNSWNERNKKYRRGTVLWAVVKYSVRDNKFTLIPDENNE